MNFKNQWRKLNLVRVTGLFLILAALLIAILGYINQHSGSFIKSPLIMDFYANISAELASIAFTILIIDYLTERRELRNLKARLIRELQTTDNGIARRTMRELMAHKWHSDGSLHGHFLNYANLETVYLRNTDFTNCRLHQAIFKRAWMRGVILKGANLTGSNFSGARRFTPRQLSEANKLVGSTMPNGERYDGRFNLAGDFELALRDGHNLNEPESMAAFYRVPLQTYAYWQENPMTDTDTDWENLIEQESGVKPRPYYVRDAAPTLTTNNKPISLASAGGIGALVGVIISLVVRHLWNTNRREM